MSMMTDQPLKVRHREKPLWHRAYPYLPYLPNLVEKREKEREIHQYRGSVGLRGAMGQRAISTFLSYANKTESINDDKTKRPAKKKVAQWRELPKKKEPLLSIVPAKADDPAITMREYGGLQAAGKSR